MDDSSLAFALKNVQESLIVVVRNVHFSGRLAIAFGIATDLAQAWSERDFSVIPKDEVLGTSC